MAPSDQKQQVQQATDLVRLIGEQVALRPRGKEFVGLCPFHDDKNPSMYVSPAKQIYKCFSCGAGGDAFSFVMNYHRMTFPEALRFLAEKAGIKLEEKWGKREEGEGPTNRQLILQANAQAAAFYQALLRHGEHGKIAREYLAQRSISPEMIEAFQIGYAPDRWDGLALMINERQWNHRGFALAGLITSRDRSANSPSESPHAQSYYDRFRHRLMFPIADAIGQTIALGGRVLAGGTLGDKSEAKYLNSPESPVFNKSATLYGLHLAKKTIIDKRTAVIVEGYTDVIACHQAGFKNIVATLGTALTPQHVTELRRYCEKVILIYDADEAGIKAADRAVEVFLTEQLDVAIAILPGEMDPADLFGQSDGADLWVKAMAAATDALEFQFQRVQQQIGGAGTVTGRQKVVEEYLRKLAQFGLAAPGPRGLGRIRESMVMQRLCDLLHLAEKDIKDLLRRLAPAPTLRSAATGQTSAQNQNTVLPDSLASRQSPAKIKALQQAERQVLGCLLRRPELFHQTLSDGRTLSEFLSPTDMSTAPGGLLYQLVYDLLAQGRAVSLTQVLADLAEQGRQDLANLATSADAEVEAVCGETNERLVGMLVGAAGALLQQHREEQYTQTRQALDQLGLPETNPAPAGAEPAVTAHWLRQIAEHQQPHPVPKKLRLIKG